MLSTVLIVLSASVHWAAPAECPQLVDVQTRLDARLGGESLAGVVVDGAIEATDGGYTLQLATEIDGERDVRILNAADCEVLTDAGVLVASSLVDPVAVAAQVMPLIAPAPEGPAAPEGPLEPSESAPAPEVPVADEPLEIEPVSSTERVFVPRRSIELRLLAAAGYEAAATPGPNAVVEAGAIVGWRRFELEAAGAFVPPRTARTSAGAVRVLLGTAAVRATARVWSRSDRFEFPVGAGLEAGGMRGEGIDVGGSRGVTRPWVAALVHLGTRVWLAPRVALRLRAEVAIPFLRPTFELRDPGPSRTLFTPQPATARITLALEGIVLQ